jgi:hypothetical protein
MLDVVLENIRAFSRVRHVLASIWHLQLDVLKSRGTVHQKYEVGRQGRGASFVSAIFHD